MTSDGYASAKPEQAALAETILETAAFFDIFNYPLTARELGRFGAWPASVSLGDIEAALDRLVASGRLETSQSFFYLPGQERLVAVRHERYNFTAAKFERAKRAARLFRLIPWIRLVAVANLIGGHNLREESDIDLLVVTDKGRLWLSRFLAAASMSLLGWRPRPGASRDKICLSFWASSDASDFSGLRLKDDVYFRYWLAGLTPLYDAGGVYERLIEANAWLKQELPAWQDKRPVAQRRLASVRRAEGFKLFGRLLDWLELAAKRLELALLPPLLKRLMNQDTRVVVNDSVLKLHSNDRRAEYIELYRQRRAALLNRPL